jgi:hypothetical protein
MHALIGSWIANLDRSQRHANHQFHQATMRIEIEGEHVSLIYGGINASGRAEHGAQTLHADGQEHPAPEAPGVVTKGTLSPMPFGNSVHDITRV